MHRIARWLSTLAVVAATAVFAGAAPGTPPPPSDYHWAQPGTYLGDVTHAEPAPVTISASLPGSSYHWAQPGTAPVEAPNAQPPAFVPLT